MDPEFRLLVCGIGHRLRMDGDANNFLVDLQPELKEVNDVLVHASKCELDLTLGKNKVIQCKYPKCNNGKILWRHISFCSGKNCSLCDSMRRIAMFHAGQCTDSNCVIPRCSEFKEKIRHKERKARKIEKRLVKEKIHHKERKANKIEKRLKRRKMERGLKRMYDMQLLESELAAAAARQLSLREGQGDDQKTECPMAVRKSILSPPLLLQ